MGKGISTVAAALLLAACAVHQAKVFDDELRPFVGKNLSAITKYIGYPDAKLEVLGKTVYTWGTDVTVCKLQITTDAEGTITTYHWEGYMEACAKFTDALDL
jgi:hypothetical protein